MTVSFTRKPGGKGREKKISHMIRLAYIMKRLYDGRRVTTRGMADHFSVDQRSIQRDMSILEQVGIAMILKPTASCGTWFWQKI